MSGGSPPRRFRDVSEAREFVRAIKDELVDQHDRSMLPFIVLADGRLWLRRPQSSWPELLGYELAGSWLNIAPSVRATAVHDVTPVCPESAASTGAVLVQLAQTLTLHELPIQDLDQAIAWELAYSVWIRRRDPSYWNRAYVSGVPVLFDHHIAFGCEDDHRDINGFLERGPDGGYAGQWRLQRLPAGQEPTTLGERLLPRHVAVHRVRNPDSFQRHLDDATTYIRAIPDHEIQDAVGRAGADGRVSRWLTEWRDELPEAMGRLPAILAGPI